MNLHQILHQENKTHQSEFDESFEREIAKSEILRSKIIMYGSILPIFGLLNFYYFQNGEFVFYFGENAHPFYIILIFIGVAFDEFINIKLIQNFNKKGKRSTALKYMTALVETSIPTVMIYIVAITLSPAEALYGPGAFIYFLFIALSGLRLEFNLCFFTGIVAAIGHTGLSYYFHADLVLATADNSPFLTSNFATADKAIIFILVATITGYISRVIRRKIQVSNQHQEERTQVLNMFGQHVSPEVVNKLLSQQQSKIDVESREVVVMFLDIRQFTTFSEQNTPEDVVHYLNTLFDFMIETINANNGIINKFLGDGFMALFGAPLDNPEACSDAVKAAIQIINKTEEFSKNGEIPKTKIGIGLHKGQTITGNIGSSARKEYTVIGDTVNLASRVEQLNKKYKSNLLITESVFENVKDQYPNAICLGSVDIRGRANNSKLYMIA